MSIIITTLILLLIVKFVLKIKKLLINCLIGFFVIWLIIGGTLHYFFREEPQKKIQDIEMAKTFIKDNPKLCKKATMKILDDGTVRIIAKRKAYDLKDGVLRSVR